MDDQNAFPSNQEGAENVTAAASQAESEVGNEVQPSSSGTNEVVEQPIPYSRLKSVVEARREAERRAEEAEERLQDILRDSERERSFERQNRDYQPGEPFRGSLPSWFSAMYGDNANSRLAYTHYLEGQRETAEQIRREAVEVVRQEQRKESESTSRNMKEIDRRLEDFESLVGRNLSEGEEAALLEIVDEYTPTNRDGKYAGDLISLEKAWDILQMRMSNQMNRQQRQRAVPTNLTSTRTQGEPSGKSKPDKNFDPKDWNAYKKRVPSDY